MAGWNFFKLQTWWCGGCNVIVTYVWTSDGATLVLMNQRNENRHRCIEDNPDSKVHGANMGPVWGRQGPGGPHISHMNFTIWEASETPFVKRLAKRAEKLGNVNLITPTQNNRM